LDEMINMIMTRLPRDDDYAEMGEEEDEEMDE
jgi:hypothetical protein